MNRLTSGSTQSIRQRGRKLRIDDKQQDLFRCDDGMVGLPGRESQDSIDIRAFEIGIILKDRFARLAGRQQAENIRDGNAQATDAGASMHAVGVDRNSRQQV
jgi:hypothetical protein